MLVQGLPGIQDATVMTSSVAKSLGLKRTEIGVCSTGVIGLPMPMSRIEPKLGAVVESLGEGTGIKWRVLSLRVILMRKR